MAIIPMKKIHLIVQGKDTVPSLERLRGLGLVHVEHLREVAPAHVHKLREMIGQLTRIIDRLTLAAGKDVPPQEALKDWRGKVDELTLLLSEEGSLSEGILNWQSLLKRWEDWGDFDPKDFEFLAKRGLVVRLCEVPEKDLARLPQEAVCQVVHTANKVSRCVVVTPGEVKLPFETITLPEYGLKQMMAFKGAEEKKLGEVQSRFLAEAKYLDSFRQKLLEEKETLRFEEIASGMGQDGPIAVLKGFCPVEGVEDLKREARQERWGLLVEDPGSEDQVPTLVRNPKWVEIIKPVFGVINVLPGYREVDISFIFLIFFSIFFGILIGDAGYGLILLGLTFFIQQKLKGKVADQAPFILIYVLSSCAIIWGILTGTFLGTILLSKILKPLIAWLTENKNVQMICFLLGTVHLTLAHGWRVLMKMPAVFAVLAELGWIVIIWGSFFLANAMVIGVPVLGMDMNKALIVVGIGGALVVADILSRPKDNIFIGLVLTFFSCISAFTDVISYIRLFAVGLAGVAVADAFNQMALGIGCSGPVSSFFTVLILVVGHLFNMVLCGFGILVHGLRLNVLEFSGHLGLEWAGFKYEPFKKTK